MADALLSAFLTEMAATIGELAGNQLKLVAGVDEELENLKRNLEAIKMVLKDAEKRQWKDEAVKLWMEDLKDLSYDMDQVLDDWNTAIITSQGLPKVRCSTLVRCFNSGPLNRVRRRLSLARKIETLSGKLDNIARRKDMFNFSITARSDEPMARIVSTSIVDVSKVYGQDEYKKILKDRLLCGPPSGVEVVVGMGGIGKTTLAKVVYNDDEVKSHFGKRLWVCVSDPFDIVKIANEIVEQLTGRAPAIVGLESVMQNLIALIRDDRFLLVLDDVWTEDYQKWELLEKTLLSSRSSSSGSRVVVTTRKVEVARMMGIRDESMVRMRELSEKDCWSLFSEIAFFGRRREDIEDFEEIGREIALKCKGFPLAAKALGSLLRVKRTKAEWRDASRSEIWRLEKIRVSLFHPLLLSYLDLSPAEKRCLSYCAIFPKGQVIGKKGLIYMWMAQGYFGPEKYEDGERCFESLAALSFFHDFKYHWEGNIYVCKMHDIVHDFVRFLTLDEHSLVVVANSQEKIELSTRHLTIVVSSEDRGTRIASPLLSVSCEKNLQSLMVLGHPIVDKSVIDWCSRFASLRTFILKTSERISVPESIGELVHLRYLALISSKNDASESRIPRTLGNLCNLQTLILRGFSLPEEVAKLVNLRYLSCTSQSDLKFTILPKGVVRLAKLMNLNARLCHDVSKEKFELGDLSQLNNLRELRLQDVGIDKGHVEGAKRAQLSQRTNLQSLDLFFANKDSETHESVLEALRPPPSLTFLAIMEYGESSISPTWMSSSSSLRNLKFLGLFSFPNCETLPPLGRLESLETLIVRDMGSLAKVGPEFLGISESDDDRNISLFPKLKSIEFSSMPLWVEWDGFKESGTNLRIMPCLEKLELHRCEVLKALPEFLETTPVKELVITASSELESACRDHQVWSLIASRNSAPSL